ncbi:AAA domain (dynein-related subfamily) [Pseudonocardia thermophila]|jgi:MoxR-like ATPases|uniref:AAA domain (Dynein-related subfamily) n=1 Tax=Pseudonocardia thermophila TaxID=1848 RepID=A0A1M6RY80_PSETH|nr:MoxR family ATPase [Pseudonocardia thermophila]SHK37444.1 AAA domain (dynein-related subfamily) [Pseudonocardia thermophila]
MQHTFGSPRELADGLATVGYLADEALSMAVFLALRLNRPLLLEGANGVGKTEIAKALADLLGRDLVRLQCYEGIDASQALYDWHYARQLLDMRASDRTSSADVFTREYLLPRPLLTALETGDRTVLLIDEIDRADDEFEAFLLELLSDFAVTIPEIGRVVASSPPLVVLTSNRTRDLHTALRRRCLYHWVGHPDAEREFRILQVRAPQVPAALARRVAQAVQRIRALGLGNPPGVGETIDWANALHVTGSATLTPDEAAATLGALVKDVDDQQLVAERITELVPTTP